MKPDDVDSIHDPIADRQLLSVIPNTLIILWPKCKQRDT